MKRAVRIVTVMLTTAFLTWSLQAQTLSKFDGTWRVDGVGQPFPWEVNLTVDGAKVTGTVRSCASPRQQISDGAVNGDTVTFKCRSSGGDGTIAFTGTLRGDEIDFAWSLQVREGGARPPDRNRLFGPSAPPRFIAKRVPETEAQADGVEFTAAVNLPSRDVRAIGTLFLPAKVSKARTVFVVMHYGRGESFFNDQALRTSLRGTESALLLAALPSMTTPVRYVPAGPDAGGADALIALLRRIGDESSHPELTDVPLIFWGHSAGGHFGTAFAALHPTRTLA